MKFILLITFILLSPVNCIPEDFIWKNRIIIYSGEDDFSLWKSISLSNNIADRRLLYFHFEEGELKSSNVQQAIDTAAFFNKLNLNSSSQKKWVLIGLDGGLKNSGKKLPTPAEIFALIDAMPMRQSEIRKSGN
jgi:hypothetical protein